MSNRRPLIYVVENQIDYEPGTIVLTTLDIDEAFRVASADEGRRSYDSVRIGEFAGDRLVRSWSRLISLPYVGPRWGVSWTLDDRVEYVHVDTSARERLIEAAEIIMDMANAESA